MGIGNFVLAIDGDLYLYLGLGGIIVGCGLLKPNTASIIGEMYLKDDPYRDKGFTIFYIGINLGSFLASLGVGAIGEEIAWSYGFITSGVAMCLAILCFIIGWKFTLTGFGDKKENSGNKKNFIEILRGLS